VLILLLWILLGGRVLQEVNVVDQLRAREWSVLGRYCGDVQPLMLRRGETQQMQFAEPARAADVDYCPQLNLFLLPGDS
jgi:hypothetical protein